MLKSITISNVLDLNVFNDASIVTSHEGLGHEINNITIMDIPDIENWLQRNDLLIIGRFMETNVNTNFIKSLHKRHISGIITKKKFQSYVSQEVKNLCLTLNIPLIFCNDIYSWSQVMVPIQELIIHQQNVILKDNVQFYDKMIQLITKSKSTHSLCQAVYDMSGLSLAIMDSSLTLIDMSAEFDWHNYLLTIKPSILHNQQIVGYDLNEQPVIGVKYVNHTFTEEAIEIIFFPAYYHAKLSGYVLIKKNRLPNLLNERVIGKINSFIRIYTMKNTLDRLYMETNLHKRNLIFEDILSTKLTPDNKKRYSLLLGTNLENKYYMVTIFSDLFGTDNSRFFEESQISDLKDSILESFLKTQDILMFSYQCRIIFLIGEGINSLDDSLKDLDQLLQTFYQHSKFSVGVSSLHQLENLDKAYKESLQAINYLHYQKNDCHIQKYDELGILNLFTDDEGMINTYYIERLITQFIQPLLNYDSSNNTDLIETITCFFNNNFSKKSTSELLFIHVNTLRSRLKKVETLLHVDLNASNDLLNIQLALKLYEKSVFLNIDH